MHSSEPTVLFIAGWGRSGSTLFERVLGQAQGLVSTGELAHIWARGVQANDLCGCGLPFHECAFWHAVGQTAFGGWDQVDVEEVERLRHKVNRYSYVVRQRAVGDVGGDTAAEKEFAGVYSSVLRAVHEVSGADVIIDSSKHPAIARLLSRNTSFDLRVLHLVRDPRGVAFSWAKELARVDSASGTAMMPRYSTIGSGLRWSALNAVVDELRHVSPYSLARYEDFVADPSAALGRVAQMLDLPELTSVSFAHDRSLEVRPTHSVAGNPSRMQVGRITLRQDVQWQDGLPSKTKSLIDLLTWRARRKYGYGSWRRVSSRASA